MSPGFSSPRDFLETMVRRYLAREIGQVWPMQEEMWRDAGGTHASVCTMSMGFKTAEAHIEFMSEVKARIAQ